VQRCGNGGCNASAKAVAAPMIRTAMRTAAAMVSCPRRGGTYVGRKAADRRSAYPYYATRDRAILVNNPPSIGN